MSKNMNNFKINPASEKKRENLPFKTTTEHREKIYIAKDKGRCKGRSVCSGSQPNFVSASPKFINVSLERHLPTKLSRNFPLREKAGPLFASTWFL